MILAILFGSVVTLLSHSTYSLEDCKKIDFKNKACHVSKEINKLAK